ncbi:minor capsid protein [Leucobacter allii]|uniref:Minor capsid protein n=1 Tax=Leucobacter allii TaxID=2932247 RepID=A0ABY4FP86_9MICO|nr:minor capsid protein [Leucobacter allii]UOQ58098.1 minor capsid protein [Leucobacter allii]
MISTNGEWHGDIVSAMLQGNAAEALNHGAELLRGYSVPLAPKDQGDLRGSAQVTPATPGNLEAHVSYDTPYAARQHEELDWRHDDGQAKYLEQPLEDHRDDLMQAIAARLGKGLP